MNQVYMIEVENGRSESQTLGHVLIFFVGVFPCHHTWHKTVDRAHVKDIWLNRWIILNNLRIIVTNLKTEILFAPVSLKNYHPIISAVIWKKLDAAVHVIILAAACQVTDRILLASCGAVTCSVQQRSSCLSTSRGGVHFYHFYNLTI